MSRTPDRILGATRALVEREDRAPSMSEVARAAGLSRQAVYLHFPDRAALLVALVDRVDAEEGLAEAIADVRAAADGEAMLRAWIGVQVRRNPRIATLGRVLDAARAEDEPSAAAWRDRLANRMRGATEVAARLRADGRIHRSWPDREAVALVWELVSFHVWDDLVTEARLPPARYEAVVTTAVLAALAAPLPR